MVWVAKRPGRVDGAVAKRPGDAAHHRHLNRLGRAERRQDSWQAGGEHRFAGAGRADH